MNKRWEVCFTVYENDDQTSVAPFCSQMTNIIECFMPQQAQAMIESQYGRRVLVHYVREA